MMTFDLRSGGAFAPREFPLGVARRTLAPGEGYAREGVHGDEGFYVRSGSVRVDGRTVEAGGAVIVEADAAALLTAGADGAGLVHFAPGDPAVPTTGAYGAPAASPRGVHLIGPRGLLAIEQPGRTTRFFADSTCPTCRITLFSTARDDLYRSASHSHSQDEILYVLDGEIHLAGVTLGPDMGVAIPGGAMYGFRSGDDGFRFLNYRRDVSTYRSSARKTTALERPRDNPDVVAVDDVR